MSKKKKQVFGSSSNVNASTTHSGSSDKRSIFGVNTLAVLVALIVTYICFTTAIKNDFVNWDDDRNFYENPLVQNITDDNFWANTKEIFSSGVIGNYNPLTIWTFALEKKWYGLENTSRWHLDNIILHLICVLLVYYISMLLGLSWRGALFVALLFGIHPMRVESVAWVTERKDVLFGVFYLSALYQYLKIKQSPSTIRWMALVVFFLLSLFSKIQAVSLPLSMMAIDYYLDRRWDINSFLYKIPLFALSIGFGVFGIYMLRDFGSLATVEDTTNFNFIQRLFIGAFSFVIYLIKLILPFRMSPLYPYPNAFPWYFYPSILIAPIVLYTLYVSVKKEYNTLFFGLSFFIVNIIFLLQILGAGQGYLADRFTYIAYFGLFFIGGYLFDKWSSDTKSKPVVLSIAAIMVLVYGSITFQQNKIWKNSGTLWTHVLKYYKNTTLPYGNRANYYRDNRMYKEALADYNATISMKDEQPQAYNSRARLFFTLATGRDTLLLALNDYNKAIQYNPTDGEFLVNRGATFARLGDIEKAILDFNEGLKLKPDHAVGYLNRSIMYQNMNRIDLAYADIETYLTLNPYNADLWYEKARALRLLERPQEAIIAYTEAIALKSTNSSLYFYERSRTYAGLNMINEAKADLQQSINAGYNGIDPAYRIQLGM